MKNGPFTRRLGYAWHGMVSVFTRERSFRTQCVFALGAAVMVAVLRPGWLWTALIALSIALVLALELFNSAFEALIDHLHPDIHPEIKVAKDAAAGAVLIASLLALVVGASMLAAVFGF
jgi:undecaprenol kinase